MKPSEDSISSEVSRTIRKSAVSRSLASIVTQNEYMPDTRDADLLHQISSAHELSRSPMLNDENDRHESGRSAIVSQNSKSPDERLNDSLSQQFRARASSDASFPNSVKLNEAVWKLKSSLQQRDKPLPALNVHVNKTKSSTYGNLALFHNFLDRIASEPELNNNDSASSPVSARTRRILITFDHVNYKLFELDRWNDIEFIFEKLFDRSTRPEWYRIFITNFESRPDETLLLPQIIDQADEKATLKLFIEPNRDYPATSPTQQQQQRNENVPYRDPLIRRHSRYHTEGQQSSLSPGPNHDFRRSVQSDTRRSQNGFEVLRGAKGEISSPTQWASPRNIFEKPTGRNSHIRTKDFSKIGSPEQANRDSSNSRLLRDLSPNSQAAQNLYPYRSPPSVPRKSQSDLSSVQNSVASSLNDDSSNSIFSDAPEFEESTSENDSFWAVKPKSNSNSSKRIVSFTSNESQCENLDQKSVEAGNPALISRKNSFLEHGRDWAARPPTSILYENLEDFFPGHDLDKPIIEDPDYSTPETPRMSLIRKPRRIKSIRIVAREAVRNLSINAPTDAQQGHDGMIRRKSSRLWGLKTIEMKPGYARLTGARSEPDTFKWVRGELIGVGTHGRVFLGMNVNTGEMIAVKQVDLPQMVDSSARDSVSAYQQFNHEIENMKDLDHKNIVAYLGYQRSGNLLSIFLEYISGGSIGNCLRRHGKFNEQLTRVLTQQTLEGLAYLHSKGILHRDLKSDNLLLDLDGVCKISDFGISKRSSDIYGNDGSYSMQGTIFWMAPEVIQNDNQGYSAKVDIWSLGCVVLEMLAGRRPWSSEEAIDAMLKLGRDKMSPPIPSDIQSEISCDAQDFLRQCFRIDPSERPTAQQLLCHPFCAADPTFNFEDSELARKIRPTQRVVREKYRSRVLQH